MPSTQSIPGIASGFDTASIIEQLMKIEKQPYDKLDVKKQTTELKKQAYQAVNSMMLKFKSSVGNLASQSLWKAKSATSTNEKSLTATANQYAVNGSYSFKVAQLATAAQFMTKGFANTKTAFVKQAEGQQPYKMGEITLNNAKSRVDTSAKLEDMNGGRGVYRGSIRVTDSANHSSIIDLSSCATMDDVVRTINGSTGAQINAEIIEGKLVINDESGGTGKMKIQNHGIGTTATDLGIAGSASAVGGSLTGRNVYYLGADTGLNMINDGLGVEEGYMNLTVNAAGRFINVMIDVTEVSTVGDIVKRVNDEIQSYRGEPNGDLLEGLKFGLNADGNGFALTGTKAGVSYSFSDLPLSADAMSRATPATQLGLADKVHTALSDGESVNFSRVIGTVDSPLLKNLSGANSTGIGNYSSYAPDYYTFDPNALVADLNSGAGIDISTGFMIHLLEGGTGASGGGIIAETGLYDYSKGQIFNDILDPAELNQLLSDKNLTTGALVDHINQKLAAYAADPSKNAAALTGLQVTFVTDPSNTGPMKLSFTGASSAHIMQIGGSIAGSLGLTRAGGAALQNPDGTVDQATYKAAVDAFYTPGQTMMPDNVFIGASTKLSDLTGFDIGKFNGQTISIDVGGTAINVTFAADAFDPDMTVDAFLEKFNAEVQTAAGTGMSAPKLAVDQLAQGFRWSNVDMSKSFSVLGDWATNIGVDKSWAPNDASFNGYSGTVPAYYHPTGGDLKPAKKGYYAPLAVTKDTQLGNLNGGVGLKFTPANGTIDFDFGDGKKLSIAMSELVDMVNSNGKSLNNTLEEYAGLLTDLVNQKLAGQSSQWGDMSLKFAVDGDHIVIQDLKGMKSFTMNGSAVTPGNIGLSWAKVDKVTADTKIALDPLKAGEMKPMTATGLGSVNIVVDGVDYSLGTGTVTDGGGNVIEKELSGDSTLKDLISRLNREAARQGLTDVTFVINDAGTGIAVENASSKSIKFTTDDAGGTLAEDLGLVSLEGKGMEIDAYGFKNSTSLGRQYIGRGTSLNSLYTGGEKVALGSLKITDATGLSIPIDIAECKTVGDLVDAINSVKNLGVKAGINERGDGIILMELYEAGYAPTSTPTGNISVSDGDGGNIAKLMGFAGEGVLDAELGVHVLTGTQRTTIDVMSSDTLESLMYRISEKGYKTAIINDGTSTSPYRLTISSATTGEAADFVIDSDLDMFGFHQTSRGKDSKVLYGDPNSGASPTMLSAATNSNSTAILGLTLEFKSVSSEYTTINVDTDKSKVTEELKNMVQTYNDLNDLVSYLDAYDPETGQPGILFGDTSIRQLMEDINDMFYLVFNPNNMSYNDILKKANASGEQQTWTWMDLGVSLTAKNTNTSDTTKGSWYSSMDLDLDKLETMVSANWDTLYNMLAGQRNASDSTLPDTVKATSAFNGKAAEGFKADNAINGDTSKGSWGVSNGFMADGTIKSGANEYTIYFQKSTTISRMSIYHMDTATALKDFTVEYLDASTGKWETLRDVKNNSTDANHLGFATPTSVTALRITAKSTNASDDKFRLLDVQVFEDTGLAGQLNQTMTRLGDSTSGWLAERNTDLESSIRDITEQMERLQSRLDSKEESLWRQFTAMETAMSKLQGQGNYFSSMMSSISSNSK